MTDALRPVDAAGFYNCPPWNSHETFIEKSVQSRGAVSSARFSEQELECGNPFEYLIQDPGQSQPFNLAVEAVVSLDVDDLGHREAWRCPFSVKDGQPDPPASRHLIMRSGV